MSIGSINYDSHGIITTIEKKTQKKVQKKDHKKAIRLKKLLKVIMSLLCIVGKGPGFDSR